MLILYIALGFLSGSLIGLGYVFVDTKKVKREVATVKLQRAKQADTFYQIKSSEMLNYSNIVDTQFATSADATFVGFNCGGGLSESDALLVDEVFKRKQEENISTVATAATSKQEAKKQTRQQPKQEQLQQTESKEQAKDEQVETKVEQQPQPVDNTAEQKVEIKTEDNSKQKQANDTPADTKQQPSVWQSQAVTDTQQPQPKPVEDSTPESATDSTTENTTSSQPQNAFNDDAKKNSKTKARSKTKVE